MYTGKKSKTVYFKNYERSNIVKIIEDEMGRIISHYREMYPMIRKHQNLNTHDIKLGRKFLKLVFASQFRCSFN